MNKIIIFVLKSKFISVSVQHFTCVEFTQYSVAAVRVGGVWLIDIAMGP